MEDKWKKFRSRCASIFIFNLNPSLVADHHQGTKENIEKSKE